MVKMKALRSFGYPGANEGPVSRGHEFDAKDENRAKDLEAHGLAYRLQAKAEPKFQSKAESAPENKAASAGPLPSVGGGTGEAAPAPSSPPARQQRPRLSLRSAGGSR